MPKINYFPISNDRNESTNDFCAKKRKIAQQRKVENGIKGRAGKREREREREKKADTGGWTRATVFDISLFSLFSLTAMRGSIFLLEITVISFSFCAAKIKYNDKVEIPSNFRIVFLSEALFIGCD